jgi:hypothetical protein
MAMRLSRFAAALALVGLGAASADAAVISFTGGTVTRLDATTAVTNNVAIYDGVDFYVEDGFMLDFLPDGGSAGFATHVGNYYNVGNDVIHSHWEGGGFGGVTTVQITKVGGGTFDLNYFLLTSNTITGGGAANGTERAFVQGFVGGIATGAAMLLPSEDWGFPAAAILLGSDFDAVDEVRFFVESPIACFGMDEFFIDEAAPVAEPSLLLLTSAALGAVAARRRRNRNKA